MASSVGVHPPAPISIKPSALSDVLNKKSFNPIWHNPAVADLFFDGVAQRTNRTTDSGLASLASSAILAIQALDDLSNQLIGADRNACIKVAKALGEMLRLTSAIASPSAADLLGASLATAEKLLRVGAAVLGPAAAAAASAAAAAAPLLGGADDGLLRHIGDVTARVRGLAPGQFCLVPSGWTRKDGPDHALVRRRALSARFLPASAAPRRGRFQAPAGR